MGDAIYADKNFIEVRQVEKFDALDMTQTEVQIEYRITTPFKVMKAVGDDSPDVIIRGPVYVGSDEMLDRHGELVDAEAILAAWKKYSKNPVILYNHSKTYGVIGKMTDVAMGDWDDLGNVPLGTATIDAGEKDIARKINKGMLKAFSIGFIAKAAVKVCESEEDCYIRFTEIDWVETSVVDIPASPGALFSVQKTITLAGVKNEGAEICDCGGECCSSKSETSIDDNSPETNAPENLQKLEKEEIAPDIFTTSDEATERAAEIGCIGYHEIEDADGEGLFMPCKSHEDYEDTLAEVIDEERSDGDSVKNPIGTPVGLTEQGIMTDAEITMDEKATEDPIDEVVEVDAPLLTETKTIEEVVEKTETESEVVEEEIVEEEIVTEEVETTNDKEVNPSGVEVLMEVVSVLKDFENRIGSIESTIDNNKSLSETIEQMAATIAERDLEIESLTTEKEAVAAEAEIEAEVAKRVAGYLNNAGIEPDAPAEVQRKSGVSTTDDDKHRQSGVTRFDPQPKVSKGMNGLASWLEANISTRGSN
jgi:HK97 family phage prohead protease